MASCMVDKLLELKEVLGSLSHTQDKVKKALGELVEVLYQCITMTHGNDENDVRNHCFSMGIAKALLGIMRSSSDINMLTSAVRASVLLAHGNDEGRTLLGKLGAIPILLNLLLDSKSSSAALWPKEWVPVYEQVLMCLRKLTYFNATNQQELARIGGIKLIIGLVMDKGLFYNYGQFPANAKKELQSLILGKKFVSRVFTVPKNERALMLHAFPPLSEDSPATILHYPAFYVDLVDNDGAWLASTMLDKGVVWPDSVPSLESAKWTCVMVQHVEDGCSFWCQFCTQNPSEEIMQMNKILQELVGTSLCALNCTANGSRCMCVCYS